MKTERRKPQSQASALACVGSSLALGPEGRASLFDILTHSEDGQGSVRSHRPAGFVTHTLEYARRRTGLESGGGGLRTRLNFFGPGNSPQ